MNMSIHARLTKVDEEKRIVYGRAVDETPDRSGEAFDYTTSKAHFQEWSKEAQDATDGKSFGNLRAMHGKVAAGKLVGIDFDDVNKAIDVSAHVVDDNEWKKVMEGVYTGFSIGGSYVKKWADGSVKKADGKPVQRYTAKPSELSLVDRPCIPSAKFFDVQKADGSTVQSEFKSVLTDEAIETAARELCKAAGEQPDMLDTTDGINQPFWKHFTSAAIGNLTKGDEIPDGDGIDNTSAPAEPAGGPDRETMLKALTEAYGGDAIAKYSDEEVAKHYAALLEKNATGAGPTTSGASPSSEAQPSVAPTTTEYEVEGSDDEVGKLATIMHDEKLAMKDVLLFVGHGLGVRKADLEMAEILAKEDSGELKKGMYLVGRLASVIQSLDDIRSSVVWEEQAEKDVGSKLPTKAGNLLAAATDLLREMVLEETAELLNPASGTASPVLAMAHFGDLQKIGARNSSSDASRIQKVHDLAVELGCACATKEASAPLGDLAKGVTPDDLNKAVSEAINKALEPVQKLNTELLEKVAKLEAQPAAPRGVLRAISKGADTVDTGGAGPSIQPVVKNGQENEVATLIKMAHQSGGVSMGLRPDGSSIINK